MVVAQLAERSLPTPEIRRSNPNIGYNFFDLNWLSIVSKYGKDENKLKEAENGPFKRKILVYLHEFDVLWARLTWNLRIIFPTKDNPDITKWRHYDIS